MLLSSFVIAIEIPNPLSLEQALEIGKNQSLEVQKQQLIISTDLIDLLVAQSNFDLKASLDLQLAQRDQYSDNVDDSYTFIRLEKTLFEQSSELGINTAQQTIANAKQNLANLKKEKNIDIMRRFFDVVLVDMQLETMLERLAISAIRANNVQDDFDINKASEVELLEKQAITQLDVSKRIKVEAEQILKRAKLADILGINYENRPDDLTKPELKYYFSKPFTSLDELRENTFKNNTRLQIMRRDLSSIKHQISNHKNDYGVVIKGNVRIGEQAYSREKNGKLRFGINLTMPLGNNTTRQQTITKLGMQAKQAELDIKQFKQNLSSQVLMLWLTLNELKQIQTSLTTELDYRDLYLERARAHYEMELESDIGDALTQFTNTEYKLAKNQFDFVITFEKLALLTGETP
ncbi:TolC family protein [Isorropodon fossajaponicum symbiont]|uniref:TolC family protein n=1 Tax=Isorropodon fossajaponicum symbiont TaxID=883811 RepID=UPI0019163C14|nr:TolC family protein [Isorropodon fossajaponicum symbiont]